MNRIVSITLGFSMMLFACNRANQPSADLQSLVDTERAFAQTAKTEGIRSAFLAFLAGEGIVFRPTPVNGDQVYAEIPETQDLLDWEPIFAEVSAAGDLGYTTGPWTYTEAGASQPNAYGHYVSVWKKQPNSTWRVVIDAGITHGQPDSLKSVLEYPFHNSTAEGIKKVADIDPEATRTELLTADRAFSVASATNGITEAFSSYAADEVRYYRTDHFPVIVQGRVLPALGETTGRLSWEPAYADVSHAGDLGYTYGLATLEPEDAGNEQVEQNSYLHIWRKRPGQSWKIVFDVTNPIPSTPPQEESP